MSIIKTFTSTGEPIANKMAGKQFHPGRRIYLDKDGNAVEASNPNKLTLLCAAHGSISMAEAIRLGLASEPVTVEVAVIAVEHEPVEVKVEAEADTKAEPKAKDKAVKPKANKGL